MPTGIEKGFETESFVDELIQGNPDVKSVSIKYCKWDDVCYKCSGKPSSKECETTNFQCINCTCLGSIRECSNSMSCKHNFHNLRS